MFGHGMFILYQTLPRGKDYREQKSFESHKKIFQDSEAEPGKCEFNGYFSTRKDYSKFPLGWWALKLSAK